MQWFEKLEGHTHTVWTVHVKSPCSCRTYTSSDIVHPKTACDRLHCEISFSLWANHSSGHLIVNIAAAYTPRKIDGCLFEQILLQANGICRKSVEELVEITFSFVRLIRTTYSVTVQFNYSWFIVCLIILETLHKIWKIYALRSSIHWFVYNDKK